MGLAATHKVYFKGTGGRKIYGILREDAHFLTGIKPGHLILLIGGNDVRPDSSPEELSSKIISLASVLHQRFFISSIHICKLLPCFMQKTYYNHNVNKTNMLIKEDIRHLPYASF
jgi:hypothetical protein